MNRKSLFLLFLVLWCVTPPVAFAADTEVKAAAPLSDAHKKFLDDVWWIISDYEKNAFLSLAKDDDRDRFIESFWENRDPTPGTKENEFKDEHYKRLEYATRMFGRESPLPGWRTDRGRVYILLGKPEFIKRFPGSSEFYPIELWHYVGYKGYDLPSSLYFMFYQNRGFGQWRLYSPLEDGVGSLANSQKQNQMQTDEQLLDKLTMNLDPEVAHAALTSIPSESADSSDPMAELGSLGTEVIQAKLQNAKNFEVKKRTYVEDILKERPVVTVYYQTGTEGIRDGLYPFMAANGNFYLNYAVEYEPSKMDLGQFGDSYYTSFGIDGQITEGTTTVVDQIVGSHEIKVNHDQFETVKTLPFQFQGVKLIVPGKYTYTMVMNNNVSRKSVTFTHDIDIPDVNSITAPFITPLMPLRSVDKISTEGEKMIRPFQFGDKVYTPNLPATYAISTQMQVYHQVVFPASFKLGNSSLILHYVVRSGDHAESETNETLHLNAEDLGGNAIDVVESIPLKGITAGNKQLLVELKQGDKVVSTASPISFTVGNEANQAIWKYSAGIPPYESSYHLLTQAQQLLRMNRMNQVITLLNNAQKQFPDSSAINVLVMRLALKAKDYARVLAVGGPLEVKDPKNKDLLWLMGWAAYGLGKYDDAVRYFERYRLEDPKKTEVLNVLGDTYYRLDLPAKALERLEQSLALNPGQQDILELKKKVEAAQHQ